MNLHDQFRHVVIVPPQTEPEARELVKRVVKWLEADFGYDETRFFLFREDVEE